MKTRAPFMRSDAIVAGIVLVVGVAVFGAVLVHAAFYAPEAESAASIVSSTPYAGAASGATFSASAPVRLIIPALNINANVQHVGISYAGNVMVPSNFTDAAWYRGSAEPGERGMAIIDGHVDNGLGLAGVFKHLADIKVGDIIYIEEASDTEVHFVVSQVQAYPRNDVPMAAILGERASPQLALITCEGAWVQGARTYDHRLVVYATLASHT